MCRLLICLLLFGLVGPAVRAEEFNYDESLVPSFDLPDVLLAADRHRVSEAEDWINRQRGETYRLVAETVYGVRPADEVQVKAIKTESRDKGNVTRKLVTLELSRGEKSINVDLLIYLPAKAKRPVPTFVAMNFNGNHTVQTDSDIPVTKSWVRNNEKLGYVENKATAASRGGARSRWPVDAIVARGYGLATIYYGDVDPDYHDGFKNGIHALFSDEERKSSSWGSISAWAWGLSKVLDYCEQDSDIDEKRVAVMGHSRLGKTSLWAGATDERFALVISNNSGCGGAALSRRRFGETVKQINTSFPHWFCDNFKKYNDKEDDLPVDQHTLIALIAPRPVLICSAQADRWADPRGEFLAGMHASDVYRLLGTDGMVANEWPGVNVPVLSRIGYHIRPGKHDVTLQDWNVYMDFADKHYGIKKKK